MTGRASAETVSRVLGRVLTQGGLSRIPRHPERRDIVLAVLCVGLRRRVPYTEIEFNDLLESGLAGLKARVDHVTCRRYMVDYGFVKRDRAGKRYFLNYPKLESALTDEAMRSAREFFRRPVRAGVTGAASRT
jgi:hypothetical protein